MTKDYPVNYGFGQGFFDKVQFETCGLIRLEGWFSGQSIKELEFPKCFVAGEEIPLFEAFRTFRPDVAVALESDNFYQGVVLTYRVPERLSFQPAQFHFNGETIFSLAQSFQIAEPAYGHLLDTKEVLHREQIYGVGPPSTTVIDEILALAKRLPPPILDFGCGNGTLVKKLRDEGIEAYGLELERAAIIESSLPEAKPFIKLYQGRFPLPYRTGEFQSVFATEVIEHIVDCENALSEIARITDRNFTITVPDISSIALCHHNAVVPWHLLESTHVNFFNQTSLERLLRKHFSYTEIARICPVTTNGSVWFGSIVGLCRK